MSNGLAVLGRSKVRTKPFASWPVFGEADEQRLLGAFEKVYEHRGVLEMVQL